MSDQPVGMPARKVRPFYWSVRREIWENRSIYIAPVAVAAVALAGFLFSSLYLPAHAIAAGAPKSAQALMMPYAASAFFVLITTAVVAVFYSLSALQGERRDRSILFWKSLPVSDTVTVLAKVAIPLVVLPVVAAAVILAVNTIMLAWGTLIVLMAGLSPADYWAKTPLPFMWIVIGVSLPFFTLWYAPLFGWLFLVSAWAKRMTFLWAVAPPVALMVLERLALGTRHVEVFLNRRLFGGVGTAFTKGGDGKTPVDSMQAFDPTRLPLMVDLWLGVIVAALLIYAVIRLRRTRDPI